MTDSANPRAPLTLFQNPRFVAVWSLGAAASTVRWLEMLATAVYVFEATGSPFMVAWLTVLRMLPLALFGAQSGALAERCDRRRLLIAGFGAMVALSLLQGLLIVSGALQLWHLWAGAFLNGVFWTIDMPARRTLLADIAGSERVGAAMSFDSLTSNGTRMLGPLLGGFLFTVMGLQGTFFLGAALYLAGVVALLRLSWRDTTAPRRTAGVWRSILDGVRFVRQTRELAGTLMITVVFNLWVFPFVSMVPVIGKDVLGLGPFRVGVLASMEGAGAMLGAFVIALMVQPRYYRQLYFFGSAACLVAILGFSRASDPLWAGMLLFLAGTGQAAFATMQATLTFLSAPAEIRRRIMGVLSVCIGVGPIGFLHVGMLANWLGAPTALTIIAVQGMLALALVYWWWPEVRR